MTTLQIASIVIGERVRKDMGDIDGLAASIQERGLLQPIGVLKGGALVWGHRRLEAVRKLGWTEIMAKVYDLDDPLAAERDENEQRKSLSPTEAVALGRLIEEQEKPKAEELRRKRISAARKGDADKLHNVSDEGTREKVASAVGMSGTSYYKAKEVVSAAEADPEKFGDLPAQMDETGNVYGTHNELKRRKGANGKNDKKLRHAVHSRARYPKPNREIQRAIDSMDGICICLNELPLKQLDPQKTKAWGAALKKSASIIARIAREVSNVKA